MNNVASELFNGISAFKALYGLGKIGVTRLKNRIATPYRVQKLTDEVFSSQLAYGSVVTVNGVITRYGSTYCPLSYAPTIPAQSRDKITGFTIDPKTKLLQQRRQTEAKFRLFQFPVQTLPSFDNEIGNYSVGFLYPTEFDSFLLTEDPETKEKDSPHKLLINSTHQAIPVLLPEATLENIGESNITLTGVISLLPEEVTNAISGHIAEAQRHFFYGFLRPYSSPMAFCIDCRDQLNSDFNQKDRLQSLPGALYVEGHFEAIIDDKYKQEFKESIPGGLFWNFAYAQYPGKTFYLSEDEHVSVIGSDPSIFGFYIEADLVNARELHNKIQHLESFYSSFRKSAANKIRSKHSIEAKFKPDFIFDHKRQRFFHPDGILASSEVDEVIRKHHELAETATWLRQAR